MYLYKVTFDNNHAAQATREYDLHQGNVKVSVDAVTGKRQVKWLTIFAKNEHDSIATANILVRDFFKYLRYPATKEV